MMRITVIGLGALGSNLLLVGRELAVRWTIIDCDHVEMKNTRSQFHPVMVIGRNKAQALQQSLKNLFKRNVESVPVRVTSDNVEQVIDRADLVVDCLDNAESRRLLVSYCSKNDIPCLHAGLAEDGSFALIRWDKHFTVDEETEAGAATCEGGENLTIIMMASAYLAEAIKRFVEDGKRLNFNVTPTNVQLI